MLATHLKRVGSLFKFVLMLTIKRIIYCTVMLSLAACSKDKSTPEPTPPVTPPASFSFSALKVNGASAGFSYNGLNTSPEVSISFSEALNKSSVTSITFRDAAGTPVPYNATYADGDKTIIIKPSSALQHLTKYTVSAGTGLKSTNNGNLLSAVNVQLFTALDSTNKFPMITDAALLDKVQQQTFKYFWDFGHPTSGLARERNSSGDVVTSGGSGFGIMAIVTGVSRGFISRQQGLERMQKIVGFLKNTADKFHGAFPHWLNGATGKVVPFSANDNGADLVETAFLVEGLLTARQYFNGAGTAEATLRNDINDIWNGVEWNWFRRDDQNVLYWHWSPDKGWAMNMQIKGWNEALVVYALAASSNTHAIPKTVYDNGWASNGSMRNGNTFYGVQLPLGPAQGGPMFFEHYSFLGINPNGLTDAYANYETQAKAHTLINHNYCVNNPKNYYGYSADCWGLTASDIKGGYTASSPTNDVGVIAPTAAIASMPYAPEESMKALKFFYYKLGDKLWGDYGFYDAFSLNEPWFADSYLAIDQGPIIVMIENYRTGLLWDLFMSSPEVKKGMKDMGFSSPNL